jgi:hypothetical protein
LPCLIKSKRDHQRNIADSIEFTPPQSPTTTTPQTETRPAAAGIVAMSSKTAQKTAINQFMGITGVDEKVALKVSLRTNILEDRK